ncbi:(d)CMP kinase [Pricia sp. S334]|uniref:Cytidylate kinase n=1 Tax=Pricia mediterranea TaxID=3076079 RepID=A0ABU3L113_9FLAO|nr:(d)CMP kinase [Pricia sp. S334]MDT7827406.1 (d)CMP kinase [Pricia sp. S334]
MRNITIAIDGYSSTGKSTLAKQLAKALEYVYVDTGAMYRAVTLFAMRNGFIANGIENIPALVRLLPKIQLKFVRNDKLKFSEMYLNGENVEKEIRQMEVSQYVSRIAEIEQVRYKLVDMQREMGRDKAIVMDGRDIGTTVFPDADLKIFMTASLQARTTRRYKELLEKGEEVTYEEVLENVQKRDYIDTHREFSPLMKAEDAIVFDNSDMGLKEQFERLESIARRYIAKEEGSS